jgi:hypothetical protein
MGYVRGGLGVVCAPDIAGFVFYGVLGRGLCGFLAFRGGGLPLLVLDFH